MQARQVAVKAEVGQSGSARAEAQHTSSGWKLAGFVAIVFRVISPRPALCGTTVARSRLSCHRRHVALIFSRVCSSACQLSVRRSHSRRRGHSIAAMADHSKAKTDIRTAEKNIGLEVHSPLSKFRRTHFFSLSAVVGLLATHCAHTFSILDSFGTTRSRLAGPRAIGRVHCPERVQGRCPRRARAKERGTLRRLMQRLRRWLRPRRPWSPARAISPRLRWRPSAAQWSRSHARVSNPPLLLTAPLFLPSLATHRKWRAALPTQRRRLRSGGAWSRSYNQRRSKRTRGASQRAMCVSLRLLAARSDRFCFCGRWLWCLDPSGTSRHNHVTITMSQSPCRNHQYTATRLLL